MSGFKYHCGACFNEWEPGPTGQCPRCGSNMVRAGAAPRAGGPPPADKGSMLHYLWIGLAIVAIFVMFGFAGCSRLFFPGPKVRN